MSGPKLPGYSVGLIAGWGVTVFVTVAACALGILLPLRLLGVV